MQDSEQELKARLRWVEMYDHTQSVAVTCRRCGISAPTLRKWWRRYQQSGAAGLCSRSRRPHKTRSPKVTAEQEALILKLRRTRHLGPKGLQRELLRAHSLGFSTRTIWKVLHRHGVSRLRPPKRIKHPKRYTRPIPGDRIQVDTCKIGPKLYQFTAIDDCTRMRVLGLYDGRTAENAVRFLQEKMLPQFPFPLQRVQSDRGSEFIGTVFQDALRNNKIKFRPNRPAAPHLNGKVERSQRTDRAEFWRGVDTKAPRDTLDEELAQWQAFYNHQRTHSSLNWKTPIQRWEELQAQVPSAEAVQAAYTPPLPRYVTNNHYHWVCEADKT